MIHFAQAQYLLLIFLIPVFFLIQALLVRLRRRKIRKFGDEKLVEQLMPSYSKSKVWVRLTLFSIGFFFFAIGLSRPQIGARLKEQEIKGAEIIIAMDVSNSMLAEDYSPNRLDRAKLAVSRLVDKLRDDRIGLVIFAGTSFVQLPVTTDYVSAKMFLNTIDTGSIPIQGTAMGDAITTCIRSFSQQSDKSRAIILITDGENHEDDPVAAAKQAAEMGIKVFTIGVGSPEGKPIPMNGELLKDKDGEIVVSRLDEEVLKEVAQAGNGAYVRAGNSEFGLNPIIEDLKKLEDEKYNSIVFEEFDEQFMYFLAIALFFFVLEMLVGDRRSKRHLFQR
jgi:Ca-activated chloride channel family protein